MPFELLHHFAFLDIGCAYFDAGHYERAARWIQDGIAAGAHPRRRRTHISTVPTAATHTRLPRWVTEPAPPIVRYAPNSDQKIAAPRLVAMGRYC